MRRRPPGSTRTDTLFPDTTLDRSKTSMESPLSDDWSVMESSLRSEARYLNPKVVQFMKSIFDDIADDVTVDGASVLVDAGPGRSEEHTSELQSLMRISYAVFCLKTKTTKTQSHNHKQ